MEPSPVHSASFSADIDSLSSSRLTSGTKPSPYFMEQSRNVFPMLLDMAALDKTLGDLTSRHRARNIPDIQAQLDEPSRVCFEVDGKHISNAHELDAWLEDATARARGIEKLAQEASALSIKCARKAEILDRLVADYREEEAEEKAGTQSETTTKHQHLLNNLQTDRAQIDSTLSWSSQQMLTSIESSIAENIEAAARLESTFRQQAPEPLSSSEEAYIITLERAMIEIQEAKAIYKALAARLPPSQQ